ncbi:beta-glucosidase [Microlunatus phosphovorus NM-1]|uniref:Beta-glucosidase n=1 Tax=Microlunatus phosphovorus (strain ATCC 700054 / DSM 10555 / JCM 9379 / NBRC 101784 / NCIMB 13414 / VKM Ac-1990 / NM-1) TaxID=1032480 RepID=F5XJQ4_MICPN|nr:beta-glucosidase [Microlunatus phosphovorus NM-1]
MSHMVETAHPDDTTSASPSWATPEVEERVEGLLADMTLEEKVAFATGDLNWNYGFYSGPLERLGLPGLQMADGPAGVRINKGDVHEGKATALPAPIALAATWIPRSPTSTARSSASSAGRPTTTCRSARPWTRPGAGRRTYLRVLRRGSAAGRRDRCRDGAWRPGAGCAGVCQALCDQQSGRPSQQRRRRHRRADHARALSAAVRGADQRGRGRLDDGLVQPGQRRFRLREPDPAHRSAAEHLRLPGLDHERLRRQPQHRGRRQRRARPGAAERGLLGLEAARGSAQR